MASSLWMRMTLSVSRQAEQGGVGREARWPCCAGAVTGHHVPPAPRGQTEGPRPASWGSGCLVRQSARSSCFHNYGVAISLAGKHGASGVPRTRGGEAVGTAAFWDLQSPEATGRPGPQSQVQCMLGLVVSAVPHRPSSSEDGPLPPQLFPTREDPGHTWACESTPLSLPSFSLAF